MDIFHLLGLERLSAVCQIVEQLRSSEQPCLLEATGTWGSFSRLLAAYLWQCLRRPVLYVCAHLDDADQAADDLHLFCRQPVPILPVWETPDAENPDDEIATARLAIAQMLATERRSDQMPFVIAAGIQAIMRRLPDPHSAQKAALRLSAGQSIEPQEVAGWLLDSGFERVDAVELPGQFAVRGGIIDIFAPAMSFTTQQATDTAAAVAAARIEFFGDQIDSIRKIDLETQLSTEPCQAVVVFCPKLRASGQEEKSIFALLPSDTLIVYEEPASCQEVCQIYHSRVENAADLLDFSAIAAASGSFCQVHFSRIGLASRQAIELGVSSAQWLEHKISSGWQHQQALLTELAAFAAEHRVVLMCENQAELQRLTDLLAPFSIPPTNLVMDVGLVHRGFILPAVKSALLTHHELFGQTIVRRGSAAIGRVSAIESPLDLQRGDYVVHLQHGIGKFLGVKMLEKSGSRGEYLLLEYADKMQIYVPVSHIHLVQKYIGSGLRRPPLSRLGTKRWQKQKELAERGVRQLAEELLANQARRMQLGGFDFGPDTIWQKEFEEAFMYPETPDQTKANQEIKADMASCKPMDRLLCGDVGYGKTELAMRAAFKAAQAGKQTAVLAPTTVLSMQHYRTFCQRFSDFPICIEVINRFTPPAVAQDIIRRTQRGQVDILIGTHRLLSDDIAFKDLGLVIIDEEQRFGVEHKERLKRFRVNVDVLSLSATPIPRTLHMAMIGLRDISALATPPLDRRSVITRVCPFDDQIIRKAILNELSRNGQVFYLHNRVQTIATAAEHLRQILADQQIRIDIAHGQMHKRDLEEAMLRFMNGQTDVLVCSTIIESGIDIPNANTIIIADADRLGLAQLHQLRGRVGRYKYRAYAYLLLPKNRTVHPQALRRLKAIEEYSELGAGFRIALRDLEIRGAGNLLGAEQSGHIHAIGYELYCKLLADAVKRLKNEPVEKEIEVVVDLGFSAYLPKTYVPSDRQRLEVYRQLAQARSLEDLRRIESRIRDIYGPLPTQAQLALQVAEIRILASQKHIQSILLQDSDLVFRFEQGASASEIFSRYKGPVAIPDPKSAYLRLTAAQREPATLLALLRKLLKR